MLGGDVGRHVGVALQSSGRGDEDDPAGLARGHAGQRRLHRQEGAGEVDVERSLPVGKRGLVRRRATGHAGIGDNDVERAARRFRRLVKRRHRRLMGDIGGDAEDVVAFAGHFGKFRLAAAADGDVDAGNSQRQCDCPTNAGAAAGDQRMLAGDSRGGLHTFNPAAASRSASR